MKESQSAKAPGFSLSVFCVFACCVKTILSPALQPGPVSAFVYSSDPNGDEGFDDFDRAIDLVDCVDSSDDDSIRPPHVGRLTLLASSPQHQSH